MIETVHDGRRKGMKRGVLSPVDTVGYWTEVKLDLVKRYAKQYSVILAKQDQLCHVYIDAFSGPGVNISRSTGKMVKGSPLNALLTEPPFCEYYLIDKDGDKIEKLRGVIESYPNKDRAHILVGDSNDILLNEILPTITWNCYRRALCFLDPYGMQVSWQVVKMAGQLGTVDLMINMPIMAISRNALRHRWSGFIVQIGGLVKVDVV
jgi:three-Cys-motif partner protein